MGKKSNLKATLLSHQKKQHKVQLQRAKEAAKKEVVKNSGMKPSAKAKGKRPQTHVRSSTIPVGSLDTILLVGEGNFSFARALFTSNHPPLAFLPPENVVATTYDSEEACYAKYPDAKDIVRDLRERGVSVFFDIDARRLDAYKELKKRKWQRVIWNFPHAGQGISNQDRNILSNQILILDFLKSVAPLLEQGSIPTLKPGLKRKRQGTDESDEEGEGRGDDNEGVGQNELYSHRTTPAIKERGTVLITLRNTPPYTLWDLSRLAKKPPPPHPSCYSPSIAQPRYVQFRSFAFRRGDWKGYEHRMTKGWVEGLGTGADLAIDGRKMEEDRTWEFYLAD